MALNLYTRYPNNMPATDPNYPVGKAINEVNPGQRDGFPLEKDWVNDVLGFFGALLSELSLSPNGIGEKVGTSQYLDAIKALPVPLDRLANGYKLIDDGVLQFGSAASGIVELRSDSPVSNGVVGAQAANTKTNRNRVRMINGGLLFDVNTGTAHSMHSVLIEILQADVSFQTATPNYLLVDARTFTGINYVNVWKTELIMKSASNIVTVPLVADYSSGGGTLVLNEAYCTVRPGISYTISGFTTFYLQLWLDPAAIS